MPLPIPLFAVLRDELRLIILGDEVVQVVVGFEDDIAAAPAVAAAGAALGAILLALERHAAFAAVAGSRVNFDFVNEHGNVRNYEVLETKKGEAASLAVKSISLAAQLVGWLVAGFGQHVDAVAVSCRKPLCRPTSANNVQSRPVPTFLPATNLVPRWRTRMLPAVTNSPPNRFTPSRLLTLSRPLRTLP